jgi:hypothetical protein
MKNRLLTICLIAVSLALIIIGIIDGQPHDVLKKAVTVCLECVGIG